MKLKLPNGGEAAVFIRHDRAAAGTPVQKGASVATTTATVKYDGRAATGVAACHAGDNFSRHRGVQLSLRRALAGADVPKDVRTHIWGLVFNGKFDRKSNLPLNTSPLKEAAQSLHELLHDDASFVAVGYDDRQDRLFVYFSEAAGGTPPPVASRVVGGWKGFPVEAVPTGTPTAQPAIPTFRWPEELSAGTDAGTN